MSVLPQLANRFNTVINEHFLNERGRNSSGTEWLEGARVGNFPSARWKARAD